MATLVWGPVTEADLPDLVDLARACLDADGGLPQIAREPMLRRYFLSGTNIGGRDEFGDLVAVAGLFSDAASGEDRHDIACGMVHPSLRRIGYGGELVEWGREHAEHPPLRVVSESLSSAEEDLYAAYGLIRTLLEHVMCHDLASVPWIPLPDGVRTVPFTPRTASAFHEAYRHSFGDRPGFPDTPRDEWLHWLETDGFRPADSRVALDDDLPVAFVTVGDGWIDQVGVIPSWRGRGLAAHLVARTLTALKRAGDAAAWLTVNDDNGPAHELYRRLGFADHGRRARYRAAPPDLP